MSHRDRVLSVLLWYCVLAWGSWCGGTLFQMLVVVPIWSADPPSSVSAFFLGTTYNQTIYNFFGPPFMLGRVLPVLIALGLAWHRPAHRGPLAVASACLVAAVVFTLVFVYPINAALILQGGAGREAAEVSAMVGQWVWADRGRFVIGAVAMLALLHAFRLPMSARAA